jgi:hypothetical protein
MLLGIVPQSREEGSRCMAFTDQIALPPNGAPPGRADGLFAGAGLC